MDFIHSETLDTKTLIKMLEDYETKHKSLIAVMTIEPSFYNKNDWDVKYINLEEQRKSQEKFNKKMDSIFNKTKRGDD